MCTSLLEQRGVKDFVREESEDAGGSWKVLGSLVFKFTAFFYGFLCFEPKCLESQR